MKFILPILFLVFLSPLSLGAVNENGFVGQLLSRSVTLPVGTRTAAIDLNGFTLVGIQLPTTFTGTTLTFEASSSIDGTFVPVKAGTSGSNLTYTVAQSTYAALDPKDFYGLNFIKVVSGSSEGSDRTLILYLKGF